MVVFVTGGSGLVGARLLPRLLSEGWECRALLRAGKPAPRGAIRVEGDLLEPASFASALQGVDAIVHLAAQFRSMDDEATWRVNHQGTRNLIAAAPPGVRLVMASTTQVYNPDQTHPGRESDLAAPTQAYPASKLAAENDLKASGLPWSILRLGFVYGEGDGHLEMLPRLSSLFQLHPAACFSLVHHRDVDNAVRLALSGALDGQTVNVVDDAPTTMLEMCRLVGSELEPSFDPLPNPWRGRADGGLIRSLGFQPVVRSLGQAVAEGLL